MTIVNRRNAILGWTVWTISKTAAKRKAKQAVKLDNGNGIGNGIPGKKVAAVSGLAATGVAVWIVRRRLGGDEL